MVKKTAKAKDNPTTTVTRVKAKDLPATQGRRDDKEPVVKDAKPSKPAKSTVTGEQSEPKKKNLLKRFLGYFKGAWYELRQVRWPNRRATIGMTAALLVFTGGFAAFILIVDLAWENLFKLLLG